MKNHIFFSFLFLWASFHGSHAQCTSYTLQNGETMSSISNGNSNLFMALINANPTINFSTATSGTTICIPTQYYSQYSLTTSTACTSVMTFLTKSKFKIKDIVNIISIFFKVYIELVSNLQFNK